MRAFTTPTTQTARKSHRCSACLRFIDPGETYTRQRGYNGGRTRTKSKGRCAMTVPAEAVDAAAKVAHIWCGDCDITDREPGSCPGCEDTARRTLRPALTAAAPIIRAQGRDDDAAYLDAKWEVHHEELRHASPYGQVDERGSGFMDGYETAIRDLDARAEEERQA